MPKCSCHFFTELFLQTMPCFIADCKYLCKQQIETKNVKPCNVLKQTDFYLIEKCYFWEVHNKESSLVWIADKETFEEGYTTIIAFI